MGSRSHTHGFTLIELVVALLVLTVTATGLFYLATSSISGNTKSLEQAAAMELAIDKIEELKNTSFSSLASGSDSGQITSGGASGGIYTRTWTVTSSTIAGVSADDLTVTVSWTGGGSISLSTRVVSPNLIFTSCMNGFPSVLVQQGWNQSR